MKDIPPSLNNLHYRILYSKEDKEFVSICDEFPSLSWIDSDEEKAYNGLRKLICNYLWEEYSLVLSKLDH